MTAHELARTLLEGPDLMVTVRGYEGGVDEVGYVKPPTPIHYDAHTESYYGRHSYHEDDHFMLMCEVCDIDNIEIPETLAIHLGGGS